jgi:hypothetical protein
MDERITMRLKRRKLTRTVADFKCVGDQWFVRFYGAGATSGWRAIDAAEMLRLIGDY